MMKPAYDAAKQIAQVRISLDHVTPKVIRVLAVPFDTRLDDLHLAFQAAMGWSNSHLYLFDARGALWGPPDPDLASDDVAPASSATLAGMIVETGRRNFKYIYDLGDEWRCTVKVQTLSAAAPYVSYPLLLSASGRTPPENIGGPLGYEDYLMALCDPSHERRSTYHESYGLDFDPAVIDIAQIDHAMTRLTRKPSRRARRKRAAPPAKVRNAKSPKARKT
jgi:hypothetical protein